jgi:hypothetical protein
MIEYPDLSRMVPQELDAFLSTTGFSSEQNDQIAQAADHNDMYSKIVTWRSIADAGQRNFNANLLLRKQRIFMPDSMRSEFQSLIDLLNQTQVERKRIHIFRETNGVVRQSVFRRRRSNARSIGGCCEPTTFSARAATGSSVKHGHNNSDESCNQRANSNVESPASVIKALLL